MSKLSKNMIECQEYYEANKKKIGIIGAAIVLLLLILSVSFITQTVKAERSGNRSKLITSVEVKQGDTLWSIASTFISDEYDSIHEYIDEIMNSNGMASEEIHAGNFIIVPYYADTSK